MPLTYDDVPGSWGRQAMYWPTYICTGEAYADRVFVACTKEKVVPYGSYVLDGLGLRVETPEMLNALYRHMRETKHKTAREVIDLYEAGELPFKCYSDILNDPHKMRSYLRESTIARLEQRLQEAKQKFTAE